MKAEARRRIGYVTLEVADPLVAEARGRAWYQAPRGAASGARGKHGILSDELPDGRGVGPTVTPEWQKK